MCVWDPPRPGDLSSVTTRSEVEESPLQPETSHLLVAVSCVSRRRGLLMAEGKELSTLSCVQQGSTACGHSSASKESSITGVVRGQGLVLA